MTASLALVLAAGVLIAAGVYLTLERSLSRIVIGLSLLGNGVNLLFLIAGGRAGSAPINTAGSDADIADPLPQDRKSTRLNSSHVAITYAVFCLETKRL